MLMLYCICGVLVSMGWKRRAWARVLFFQPRVHMRWGTFFGDCNRIVDVNPPNVQRVLILSQQKQ